MEIQPLVSSLSTVSSGTPAVQAPDSGGFGDALGDAVKSIDTLQRQADAQGSALAAGEPVEIHDVMLAYDRASLSMQLAIQVRNKMVEAYQDIMRMQV